MKAYQIVDFNNPISIEYSEISKESFKPLTESGILEIESVQGVTPETLPRFKDDFDWHPSLMTLDDKTEKLPSETEMAGMISHWHLMEKQGRTDRRFLILEHDAYLIPENIWKFKWLLKFINDHDVCYANMGLFMCCYSYSTHCAKWMYQLLKDQKFWINGGPYSVVERLFKNYTNHYLKKRKYLGKEVTVIHPWSRCNTLGVGKDIHLFFNSDDPNENTNPLKTPVTQVIKKDLSVTQDHHSYIEEYRKEPWKRHDYFHVID